MRYGIYQSKRKTSRVGNDETIQQVVDSERFQISAINATSIQANLSFLEIVIVQRLSQHLSNNMSAMSLESGRVRGSAVLD